MKRVFASVTLILGVLLAGCAGANAGKKVDYHGFGCVLSYEKNIAFNKYDIEVSFDGETQLRMTQGEKEYFQNEIPAGAHTIEVIGIGKGSNNASHKVDVVKPTYLSLTVKARWGGIDIVGVDELTLEQFVGTQKQVQDSRTALSEPTPSVTSGPTITLAPVQAEIEAPPAAGSELKVYFIDVGQADSALLTCDGANMLIDGGNAADSDLIYTFLKNHGIMNLDYVIATHVHEDHVGGLAGALN